MSTEIVLWQFCATSSAQRLDVIDQQPGLQRIRVIEVPCVAQVFGHRRSIVIIAVVLDHHRGVGRQSRCDSMGDRRLARSGSPSNTDDNRQGTAPQTAA